MRPGEVHSATAVLVRRRVWGPASRAKRGAALIPDLWNTSSVGAVWEQCGFSEATPGAKLGVHLKGVGPRRKEQQMQTTATSGRKVLVLVLATLMIALAVFAGASANRATVSDAQAKEKGPTVQMKQMLCGSGGECPW